MMAKNQVRVAIIGDASKLRAAVDDANGALGSLGRGFGAIAGVAKTAALGVAALGGGIIAAGMAAKPLIDAASDLNETISKVGVIFGEAAAPIRQFAAQAAKQLGMSERAALDASATMATFGKAAGLSGDELVTFSKDMVSLSADLASFFNTNPDEAMAAIGAALRGESEPIRKYGVLLDDATLRQRAFEMGLISSVKEGLTPAQKALAAQAEILAQTKDAQGDFARTADGAANKQRILAASVEDLKAKLGQALLPTFQKLLGFMIDKVVPAIETHVVPAMGQLAQFVEAKVVPALQSAVAWVRDNWPTIRSVIVTVIEAVRTAIDFVATEVVPRVIAAFQAIVEFVRTNWPKVQAVAEDVFGAIQKAIDTVVTYVEERWPSIEETIGDVLHNVETVVKAVIGAVEWAWGTFGDTITTYARNAWGSIRTIIDGALQIIRGALDVFIGLISTDWDRLWSGFEGIAKGTWETLKGIVGLGLNAIITTIRLVRDTIVAVLEAPFRSARDGILGVFDQIRDGFRNAVNFIIDRWNALEFTVPGIFGFGDFTVGTRKIQRLADGGIVTSPTLAVVGESGPEAVIPLSQSGMMGGGNTYNVTVQTLDSRTAGDVVVDAIVAYERRNGRSWRAA
jgi:phage-related protein